MRQIFIGYTTEGSTDVRFLERIIERTFEEIAKECRGEIETFVRFLKVDKTGSFEDYALRAAQQGVLEMGMTILCIHTDADRQSERRVMNDKFLPATNKILSQNDTDTCKIIVPIVPVRMTEAWMLADKELLKNEIGTNKTDNELGINRLPESVANPKGVIENAIRISRQSVTKRKRRMLSIDDIYLPMGLKVSIEKLEQLPSFKSFQENVRNAYRNLNLM